MAQQKLFPTHAHRQARCHGSPLVLAVTASACSRNPQTTGSIKYPDDTRDRHPIVLGTKMKSLDLFAIGTGLGTRQTDELEGFVAAHRREGRGPIIVQVPHGPGAGRDQAHAVSAVRRILGRGGYQISSYEAHTPTVAAPIRVSYHALQASVPHKCDQWPDDLGTTNFDVKGQNQTHWNFGCATQANLAAQVEDPLDFVRARPEGRIDTAKRMDSNRTSAQGPRPVDPVSPAGRNHQPELRRREPVTMTNQIDSSATMDQSEVLTPVPRVTLQAFCETHDVAAALQASLLDRRLAKAQGKIQMGGVTAAVETFRENPTPNIIVIENIADSAALIGHLEQARRSGRCRHEGDDRRSRQRCAAVSRTDAPRHQRLLITPLDPLSLVRALCDLYAAPGASRVGRTIAFVGAKGGTGASTICHNVGWAISRQLESSTVIVDLDVAFGTAGLDFNQDPPQGIAEALFAPDRLDTNMLDRLLSRCSDNLLLLAAPAVLDRPCDFGEEALDQLLELLRHSAPSIVLDMPHGWQGWQRRTLMAADEVAIVATPDLASLRNAKNMVDLLRQNRPNDADPKLILNQTGIPKRPEITEQEFAKALKLDVTAVIPFDAPLFGTASNNGQMIAEVQPSGKTAEQLVAIATALTGRGEGRRPRRSFLDPIMARFKRNKAS